LNYSNGDSWFILEKGSSFIDWEFSNRRELEKVKKGRVDVADYLKSLGAIANDKEHE